MNKVNVVIGADHRGFSLKNTFLNTTVLGSYSLYWCDVGTHSAERTDYPLFAYKVVEYIKNGLADKGLLLCGSGIGMAIAANRCSGIYAGLLWDETIARVAKEDDNVNIAVLPADFITNQQAIMIVTAWLSAQFKGGRYAERLHLIDS